MGHVFVLVEARQRHMDNFLNDLGERRYIYKTINGSLMWCQPNPRELKLFDMTVPEQCVPALLSDLAPFISSNPGLRSPKKDFVNQVAKVLRIAIGLKPIYYEPETILVKVPMIGKFLDKVARIFMKPKPPIKEYEPSGAIRHQWINIIPLGIADDEHDVKTTMPFIPEGGELV